jgi:Ca2+-binding EF-hand superfamily protein
MGMGPDPVLIIGSLRTQVSNSGRMTLSKIREGIHKVDSCAEPALNQAQLSEALGYGGVFLKTQDVSALTGFFKCGGDPSKIDVSQFMSALRGQMPAERASAVEIAWSAVSKGQNAVPLDRIMECFQATEHPRVQTREMTQDEVRAMLAHDLQDLGASHICTKETFFEYFEELSACIPAEKSFLFDALAQHAFCPANPMAVPVARLEQLTRFLCEKFQQVSHKEDIFSTVRAKFHHVDKGSTGGLGLKEFTELLTSLGMNLPMHERESLFHYLAAPCGGGRIEMNTFSAMMRKISETPPMLFAAPGGATTMFADASGSPAGLVEKIKAHLLKYHPGGLSPLILAFKQLDKEGRGFITHREFVWGLKQCGLRLGTQEIDNLIHFFDSNRDGKVTYTEFLKHIRGEIPIERMQLVEEAWMKVSNSTVVDAEALRVRYSPTSHPSVLSGKVTADQKVQEFKEYFSEEIGCGSISKAAFCEYFIDEGLSIKSTDDYCTFLAGAF